MENKLIVALIILACCIFFKWIYSYWKRKGVDGPPPYPIFGNYFECCFMQKHFSAVLDEIYCYLPEAKYVGFYKYHAPWLLARDLNFINRILISDLSSNFETDSLGYENLYLMWKQNILRPETRRSRSLVKEIKAHYGKERLTEHFEILKQSCALLVDHIEANSFLNSIDGLEMKELATMFTIEAATVTAFGAKSNCFTDADCIYLELYKKYFSSGTLEHCLTFLKKLVWQQTAEQRVVVAIKECVKDRFVTSKKKEFDLLDDFISRSYDVHDNGAILDLAIGLLETFDCTSTLITYALYEMTVNTEIQSKVQNEIKEALYLNKGVLNEKVLRKMPYLDSVLFETLRIHSNTFMIIRKCIKEHVIPTQFDNSTKDVVIERGTSIIVPVYSIHMDRHLYENPYKFYPERYLTTTGKRSLYPYHNFGKDAHYCLRHEYAFLKAKLAVATLVLKYNVTLSSKTQMPPDISLRTSFLYCENGIWIKFNNRSEEKIHE